MIIKEVLLSLCLLLSIVSSAPLYGQDGGYKGYASYVPIKALSRIGHSSEDNIDASAGSPAVKITGNPRPRDEDSSSYGSRVVPKKYDVSDYAPSQQHGYGNNRITEDSPSSPYHRATLYGQTQGGFKIADTYQNQDVDSYSNSEHNSNEDVSNSQPYEFGYALKDEHGNQQHRHETRDGEGSVRGNYGFTDENGIFRSVQYVADKEGFRASIKTNEPGTESQDPAHVILEAKSS